MTAWSDRGSVTAEFAIALPAVAVVLALGAGALAAGATGVRLQDAVADAARLVARGDSAARAEGVVTAVVPGASISIEERSSVHPHLRARRGGRDGRRPIGRGSGSVR